MAIFGTICFWSLTCIGAIVVVGLVIGGVQGFLEGAKEESVEPPKAPGSDHEPPNHPRAGTQSRPQPAAGPSEDHDGDHHHEVRRPERQASQGDLGLTYRTKPPPLEKVAGASCCLATALELLLVPPRQRSGSGQRSGARR